MKYNVACMNIYQSNRLATQPRTYKPKLRKKGVELRCQQCIQKHPKLIHALGIQSPCQRMIGVYNHLLRKVFRFHYHSQKVIGSLGMLYMHERQAPSLPSQERVRWRRSHHLCPSPLNFSTQHAEQHFSRSSRLKTNRKYVSLRNSVVIWLSSLALSMKGIWG